MCREYLLHWNEWWQLGKVVCREYLLHWNEWWQLGCVQGIPAALE